MNSIFKIEEEDMESGEGDEVYFILDVTGENLMTMEPELKNPETESMVPTLTESNSNSSEPAVPKASEPSKLEKKIFLAESSDHSGDEDAILRCFQENAKLAQIVKKKKTKSYKESRSRYRSKVKNINVANDKFIKSMKTLIPGLTDNVDRAGALEYAVRYIQFLQSKLDSDYEEDFLVAIRNDKP